MTATTISFEEMAEMADDGLIDAIGEAIRQVTSTRDITISGVELSLVVALATEIGLSCSTDGEIKVQCVAYANFMANFAAYVLSEKSGAAPEGASVN